MHFYASATSVIFIAFLSRSGLHWIMFIMFEGQEYTLDSIAGHTDIHTLIYILGHMECNFSPNEIYDTQYLPKILAHQFRHFGFEIKR